MSSTQIQPPPPTRTLLEEMSDYNKHDKWLKRFSHVKVEAKLLDLAPQEERCPCCGEVARRHQIVERGPIIDASLDGPLLLMVEQGVYACRSAKCRTRARKRNGKLTWKPSYFRKELPFTLPRGRYTRRARALGIDGVKLDGLPFTKVVERLAREFHMSPARSTAWRWHKQHGDMVRQTVDLRQWTKMELSGVVCMDEMYDGDFCILIASDPFSDLTLGYQIHQGKSVNSDQVADFMRYLSHRGINPDVVVTDESSLYPAALKEAWPTAIHQICLFHVLRIFVNHALAAVRAYVASLPKDPPRPRGRPKKLKEGEEPAPPRNNNARRKEAYSQRYLIVHNPDNLDPAKKLKLEELLEAHPALQAPRSFMLDLFRLTAPGTQLETAEAIRQAMLDNPSYQADPELSKGLKKLESDEQFAKMMTYTQFENLNRTSNAVERKNRWTRKKQKSHYRLRTIPTLGNALSLRMEQEQKKRMDKPCPQLRPRAEHPAAAAD